MFTFRKIGSIVLLSLVIIIALLFSIIPFSIKEGLKTITIESKADISTILKKENISYLQKIVRIKSLIGNDSVLNDAYNQNEYTWYANILNVLDDYMSGNKSYKIEGTLSEIESETINGITKDTTLSTLDKIVKIYPNIGEDIQLINIYDQYSDSLINAIKTYINTDITNDAIAK
jgi:hypothetical protein